MPTTRLHRIAPGTYVDLEGDLHLVVPELLEWGGYADTPENRATLTAAAYEIVAAKFPGVPIHEDP